jgi:Zn-dependent protease with chaperone function
LRLFNRIWDPAERSKHPVEIEQQPGRLWIAVPGLADRARIEQPAPLEGDLGTTRRETALDAPVDERDCQCDVAVSDEHEAGRGQLERRLRSLLRQDVLPDRITRACVEEVDAFGLSGGLEALEERAGLRREDLRRPDRGGCRLVVEVTDAEPAERDEIVIADEADAATFPDDVAALVRPGPVPDNVPEAPDCIGPLRDQKLLAQIHELERREGAGDPTIREDTVSDRTTAANAFAAGIGPSERIVFWNTLLDGRFTDRQVRFVAAHELAHLARNHIPKSIGWFTLFIVPILGVAAFLTERRGGLRNPGMVPLALLAIVAVQLVSLPLRNAVTRRYEAEADWVALTATRDPTAARGLFRLFADTSLQDPSPPWWAHILLNDHPSTLDRIEQATAWRARNP